MGVDGCLDLVEYIREECEHLHFAGLMTIGRMNHQHQIHGPNPDFTVCATSLYSKEDLKWECPHQLEGYAWSYLCKRFIFPLFLPPPLISTCLQIHSLVPAEYKQYYYTTSISGKCHHQFGQGTRKY